MEICFELDAKGHKYECYYIKSKYTLFMIHQKKCNRCLFDISFIIEAARPDKDKIMYTLVGWDDEEYVQDIIFIDGTKLIYSNEDTVEQNVKDIIEEHFPTCDDLIIKSVL